MKKWILIVTLFICIDSVSIAQVLELDKVTDFAIGGDYAWTDNLKIEFPYLYITTGYGFEIYEIYGDGDIELISRVPIAGRTAYIGVKDDYAYVNSRGGSYDAFSNRLCQINITDKENPEIINEIVFDDEFCNGAIYFYNNFLAYPYYNNNSNPFLKIYSIPDMELINNIPTEQLFYPLQPIFIKLNDSLSIKRIPYTDNHFNLYDFSDPANVIELGEINLSECNLDLIGNFKKVSENIIAGISYDGLAFWNINNILDWEFISTISTIGHTNLNFTQVSDDYLIIIEAGGLESVNISDINNPYSVDYFESDAGFWLYSFVYNISSYSNNVYIGTTINGIEHFTVTNGIISKQSDNYQYPYWSPYSYIYQNYMFLSSMYEGIWIFNINNPNQPEYVQTILSGHFISSIKYQDNLMAIYVGVEDSSGVLNEIKIYDISNPEEPRIKNSIQNVDYTCCYFDDADTNHIYLIRSVPNYTLRKYDISNEGETILEFEFTLPESTCGVFHNGYAYLLGQSEPLNQTLYIIGGLEDNDPKIIFTINNWANGYPNACLDKCGNYFYLHSSNAISPGDKYFELQTPTELTFLFTLNANSWGMKTTFHNDLLFVPLEYSSVYIYDVSGNPSGELEPIATCCNCGVPTQSFVYKKNSSNYLFCSQWEAVSVYQYSYLWTDEQLQSVSGIQLSNFPNPFSTSTTISFNIHSASWRTEDAEIKIYNIKGQLIKQFKIQNLKFKINNEVVWDGKDSSGKLVPSGVYLYRITTDSFTSDTMKMILIR